MNTDQTTQNPRPTVVPCFEISFGDLVQKNPLFKSANEALEWVNQYSKSVLKEQAEEVVKNLLGAASEERRTRGVLILERAVLAQVAWLEFFQTWSANGRFNQLKTATDDVRDADSTVEDHQRACQALLEAHRLLLSNIEEDRVRREVALATIGDLLTEKPFMETLEEHQLLLDRRPRAKDPEWCVKALDLVIAGKADKVRTATLAALAGNLQFHAKRFFGEGNAPKPKTNRVRGASKARAKARGRENHSRTMAHPDARRGYVQEGGRKKR